MKTFIPLLLSALVFSACTKKSNDDHPIYSAEQRTEDSLAILHNFEKQEACWNQNDIECYMTMYHPEVPFQTVSRMGVTVGYDSILASYNRNFPRDKMGKLHFDNLSVKCLSAKHSYAVGRFNLKFPNRERPYRGWFSVLFEKSTDGKWYMISDHAS